MNTGELHAISILHGPEDGHCKCQDASCDYSEDVRSHHSIMSMQARAAQHSMVTGHVVIEWSTETKTVQPF